MLICSYSHLLHYITCRYRGVSGSFFRKLREVDFPVSITGTQQFSMSTLTCQSTVIKDKDQVCLLNAGGTLGYQKCSYFPVKSVERLTQCCISGKVQGTGTVIQNQDFRFFTRARAMVSLCFWPPERFLPFCSSIKSSCPGLPSTTSFPCAVVSACHRSSSEASSRPHFRLSRIEPLKRAAFCGTTPILERRSLLV